MHSFAPLTNCGGHATWSCPARRSTRRSGVERRRRACELHGRRRHGTRGVGVESHTAPTLSTTRRRLSPRSSKRSSIAALPESASRRTASHAASNGAVRAAHAPPVASIRTGPPRGGMPLQARSAGSASGTARWTIRSRPTRPGGSATPNSRAGPAGAPVTRISRAHGRPAQTGSRMNRTTRGARATMRPRSGCSRRSGETAHTDDS